MRLKYFVIGFAMLLSMPMWPAGADQESERKKDDSKTVADLVKHGEYLVSRVAHCGDCHTPRDAKGEPDHSKLLQGSVLTFTPKKKPQRWADESPDITSSGLAGKLSEEDMIKFFTTGKNPQGDHPVPPMPIFRLQEQDARAVTLYLKSLPGKKATGALK